MSEDLESPLENMVRDLDPTATLVEVKSSVMRRLSGFAVLFTLGALLLYIAFFKPPEDFGWQAFLILFSLGIIYLGEQMRKATLKSVLLTSEGLFSSDGTKIVGVENVKSIDRGVFAFKPSNGFTVLMHEKQPRVWQPGLWWRYGKRIGVGGVVQASQTKSMAEILAVLVQQNAVDGEV